VTSFRCLDGGFRGRDNGRFRGSAGVFFPFLGLNFKLVPEDDQLLVYQNLQLSFFGGEEVSVKGFCLVAHSAF